MSRFENKQEVCQREKHSNYNRLRRLLHWIPRNCKGFRHLGPDYPHRVCGVVHSTDVRPCTGSVRKEGVYSATSASRNCSMRDRSCCLTSFAEKLSRTRVSVEGGPLAICPSAPSTIGLGSALDVAACELDAA